MRGKQTIETPAPWIFGEFAGILIMVNLFIESPKNVFLFKYFLLERKKIINWRIYISLQFFDRIKLFGMPAKHQPDLIYLRYVPLWKVHIFTVIQLTCLVLLWVIKASAAAVVFPMMVSYLLYKLIICLECVHHPTSLQDVFATLWGKGLKKKQTSVAVHFWNMRTPESKQFSCEKLQKGKWSNLAVR